MHIAHLFDRYLHTTMNWAYNLILETKASKVTIAAPLIVHNDFLNPAFSFEYAPFQWQREVNEWSFSNNQQQVAQLFFQVFPLYQQHLYRRWKQDKPDILHAHFANVAWRYLSLSKKLQIPLVVSFYGYDYEQLPFRKPVFRKRYAQLFREAAAILCEGEHGKSILINQGCPAEKIHVVPLGILPDQVSFHPRTKKEGSLKLLQAATFTEKKGHFYSVQALLQALPQCPNLHLTLVGEPKDPNMVAEIQHFIHKNNLKDKVTMLDFVPLHQFHDFLKDYDVFIQPSCYASDMDCEGGAPIVLLDAQASGMPVISTLHCDIPSEVVNGKTGLLTPERNPEELARSIQLFYEMDNETYQQFSAAARNHVVTHFDIRKSGKALSGIYRSII
jgi:colanic acid/amylovoran biosynthesis glycosyltransferase